MPSIRSLALVSCLVLGTGLLGCRKKQPPPPPPAVAVPEKASVPWTWQRLGGLLVVEGEVEEPLDLVLRGRYMNDRMHAEFGPVRWELYAPPPGEVAELRTADGRLLARWNFDAPPEAETPSATQPAPPAMAAKPAPPAKKAKAAPKPIPPVPVEIPPPSTPQPTAPPVVEPAQAGFWPDTHLPLSKGPTKKPAPQKAPQIAKAAPPAPKKIAPAPVKAPPPPVPPPAATEPVRAQLWPDTHLPLFKGPTTKPAPQKAPQIANAAPTPSTTKAEPSPVTPTLPAPPPTATLKVPELTLPVKPPTPMTPLSPPLAGRPLEWPGAGEALNLFRGPRGNHWVCLTFDGGSTAEVASDVLEALKERGILTTFFLTGDFILKYPEIVKRMNREGHEIGNHTMEHPHLAPGMRRDPRWTRERFQQQLLQADAAFLRLTGRPMDPYWRAPYGEHTAEIRKWAEELGYRHVGWSEGADTLDWATVKERKLYRTGNAILDRLYERMQKQDGDGLIVLMHLGSGRPESDRPARVLGPFLDQALDSGWNFVNISAYLKESGKPYWNASNRLAMLGQMAHRQ